jgi:hypothetical protein
LKSDNDTDSIFRNGSYFLAAHVVIIEINTGCFLSHPVPYDFSRTGYFIIYWPTVERIAEKQIKNQLSNLLTYHSSSAPRTLQFYHANQFGTDRILFKDTSFFSLFVREVHVTTTCVFNLPVRVETRFYSRDFVCIFKSPSIVIATDVIMLFLLVY